MNNTEIPIIGLVNITPALAAMWLQGKGKNRRITNDHVVRLSIQMSRGKWRVTGDTIKFCGEELIDGQHRLSAVVLSGATIQCFVAYGVQADVFPVLDTGRGRTSSDVLSTEKGATNIFALSASARVLYHIERKQDRLYTPLSNEDVLEVVRAHPSLNDMVNLLNKCSFARHAGITAPLYWIDKCNTNKAQTFIYGLINGVGLDSSSPIYQLRERLIRGCDGLRSTREGKRAFVALVFRGWQHFLSGRTMKGQMKISNVESADFPWPAGGPYIVPRGTNGETN
jgi:hypothetical protein